MLFGVGFAGMWAVATRQICGPIGRAAGAARAIRSVEIALTAAGPTQVALQFRGELARTAARMLWAMVRITGSRARYSDTWGPAVVA
jgi:hypothetical protein